MPDASRLLGAPTNLLEWLLATTGYQPRQAINHDGLPATTGYQPWRAISHDGKRQWLARWQRVAMGYFPVASRSSLVA